MANERNDYGTKNKGELSSYDMRSRLQPQTQWSFIPETANHFSTNLFLRRSVDDPG